MKRFFFSKARSIVKKIIFSIIKKVRRRALQKLIEEDQVLPAALSKPYNIESYNGEIYKSYMPNIFLTCENVKDEVENDRKEKNVKKKQHAEEKTA